MRADASSAAPEQKLRDDATHALLNSHGDAAQDSGTGSVLTVEELRLLAEIGFMATTRGQCRRAKTIFEGLRELRPASPAPYIGLALAHLGVGAMEEAARVLREDGLRANPGNGEVLAFLGLVLSSARHFAECERVLVGVLDQGESDTPEHRLALRLLQQRCPGWEARRTPASAAEPSGEPTSEFATTPSTLS
jgi:hypothetical protein